MPALQQNIVPPQQTATSHYEYEFTVKHHTPQNTRAAQWDPNLTLQQEFSVFDLADEHTLADQAGNLYGILRLAKSKLIKLGTASQCVAKFWLPNSGNAWHGFPAWPLGGPIGDNLNIRR